MCRKDLVHPSVVTACRQRKHPKVINMLFVEIQSLPSISAQPNPVHHLDKYLNGLAPDELENIQPSFFPSTMEPPEKRLRTSHIATHESHEKRSDSEQTKNNNMSPAELFANNFSESVSQNMDRDMSEELSPIILSDQPFNAVRQSRDSDLSEEPFFIMPDPQFEAFRQTRDNDLSEELFPFIFFILLFLAIFIFCILLFESSKKVIQNRQFPLLTYLIPCRWKSLVWVLEIYASTISTFEADTVRDCLSRHFKSQTGLGEIFLNCEILYQRARLIWTTRNRKGYSNSLRPNFVRPLQLLNFSQCSARPLWTGRQDGTVRQGLWVRITTSHSTSSLNTCTGAPLSMLNVFMWTPAPAANSAL